MASNSSGAVVLLAAGRGARFGSDKRQHRMAHGVSLLQTTLKLYEEHYSQVLVVLRSGEEELGNRLLNHHQPTTGLVFAKDAALGMGHSLASAADVLLAQNLGPKPISTLTVALADMPYVLPSTLLELQNQSQKLKAPFIIQPSYQDKPGNPVTFSASYLEAFTRLQGDQGARAIVRSQTEALCRLPVEDPGVLQDIDQPQDVKI